MSTAQDGTVAADAAPAADVVVAEELIRWPSDSSAPRKKLGQLNETVIDNPLQEAAPQKEPRFLVDEAINAKIVLWRNGDLTRISIDAIVNSTNETLNERNGLSERIIAAGGKELAIECATLEGCRTGEAKITAGYSLPSRSVIHTVGPRFNLKYKTAAESALHNCYRSSLELAKEHGLSSIAFSVINSVRRGYPPEAGAHMALRTIRRFLERFGKGVDLIVLCLNEDMDIKAYENLLPMYFPRDQDEVAFSAYHLPDDIGNEMGEPVQMERKIRIHETPRLTSLDAPSPTGGAAFVVQEARRENGEQVDADDDEAIHQTIAGTFGQMMGDHDSQRREQLLTKNTRNTSTSAADEHKKRYLRLVKRARAENLSDIASENIMYQSGMDSLGRPIICIVAKNYNSSKLNRERALLYLVQYLDSIANKDYCVVYFNTDTTSDNRPDFSFVREVYSVLDPKYRRNLKTIYILHPTFWVRLAITIMNTFFTSDIRDKIRNMDKLADLYEVLGAQNVKVPDFVLEYDRKLFGDAVTTSNVDTFSRDNL